jgi:hypothetical protein
MNKRLKNYNYTPTIEKIQRLDNIEGLADIIKDTGTSTNSRKSIKNMLIDEGINVEAKEVTHKILLKGSEKNQLAAASMIFKITGDLNNDNTPSINAQGNINVNIIDRFELKPTD